MSTVTRIPILKIGDNLLVSLQGDLDDNVASALQEDLTQKVASTGARGVLIEISALEIVDSYVGRVLSDIASSCRLLAAETVVVGMRPPVAMTLVALGLNLDGVRTALNAEKGMEALSRPSGW